MILFATYKAFHPHAAVTKVCIRFKRKLVFET